MKTYTYPIKVLKPGQVFVFGSNTEGRHGKGAALWAVENAGAKYGLSIGRYGNSYAIVTKNLKSAYHPSISERRIKFEIKLLYEYAFGRHEEFLIAYRGNQNNLNGYSPAQMAKMFARAGTSIPENIVFEKEFAKLVKIYL